MLAENDGRTRRHRGWLAAVLVAVVVLTGCGGGYSRQEWHDTFTTQYQLSGADASCILNAVEHNGLEERFAGDSAHIDDEVEEILRDCVPVSHWPLFGIGL